MQLDILLLFSLAKALDEFCIEPRGKSGSCHVRKGTQARVRFSLRLGIRVLHSLAWRIQLPLLALKTRVGRVARSDVELLPCHLIASECLWLASLLLSVSSHDKLPH